MAPVAQQPDDVADWINRVKGALEKPETITAAVPGAKPFHNQFWNCFDPIETCAITCCFPCVTFGKTHHRLHHDANLKGYSAVNATCLGYWFTACFGGHVVMQILQRAELKQKFSLGGDCVVDSVLACCCACCDVIQMDKEAEYQLIGAGAIQTQPVVSEEMKVPAPPAAPLT